MTTQ
ncbi:hypothetical protein YPPY34_0675, partial [Yersinia pestis PY-34]|jgi:hypothetical protein